MEFHCWLWENLDWGIGEFWLQFEGFKVGIRFSSQPTLESRLALSLFFVLFSLFNATKLFLSYLLKTNICLFDVLGNVIIIYFISVLKPLNMYFYLYILQSLHSCKLSLLLLFALWWILAAICLFFESFMDIQCILHFLPFLAYC